MLYLVLPTFLQDSGVNYATINSVESTEHVTLGSVLDQGKLNDLIIKKLKEIYPNPAIQIRRLNETEFYTIKVTYPLTIDLAGLTTTIDIDPVLSLRYNTSDTNEENNIKINKMVFNINTTLPDYIPLTDKQLYENEQAGLQEIMQYGYNLSGNNLNDINLTNTYYSGAKFSGSEMNDGDFTNAKLIGADFTDSELADANFNGADLRFADFSVASVEGKASFVGANLKFANLSGANLTGADLTGADLRHANLTATIMTDCIIDENTKLYGAIIDDTVFDENFDNGDMNKQEEDEEYEDYMNQTQGEGEEWEQAAQEDEEENIDEFAEDAEIEDDDTIEDEAVEGEKDVCFDYIFNEDKKIVKYLQKNPLNIVIKKTNGEFECESLNSLRKQYKNERSGTYKYYGYYECSKELMDKVKETGTTPMAFGPTDYDATKEYVKIGSALSYIEKPDWMYAGPPAEPRIFELVSTGEKKYLVEKSLTKRGANVVSGIHCDLNDYFEIFKLVPIQLEGTTSGGKNTRRKHKKTHKKTQKKTHKKQHKKTQKKTHKKTHKKQHKKNQKKTHKKTHKNKKVIKKF